MARPSRKEDRYPYPDRLNTILRKAEHDMVKKICDAMLADLDDLCEFMKEKPAARIHVSIEYFEGRRYASFSFDSSWCNLGWLADPVSKRLHHVLHSKIIPGQSTDRVYVTSDGLYILDRPDLHHPTHLSLKKCID